jgi:serine/threonine-protein phosphatase 2A regulatory subunit B
MELMVEASPRRIYANAHTYHINSISVNSDAETYLSADDLRINLWHLDITDQSFNIVDIKPANMEELTEVITAAEFHPTDCNHFVYSSSKGLIRLCDMRMAALCDRHAKRNAILFIIHILLAIVTGFKVLHFVCRDVKQDGSG